jgi:hypothetical protein
VSASALAALAEPRRLSPARRAALVAEIALTYARVRWALRGGDLRVTLARLRAPATGPAAAVAPRLPHAAGVRLGWIVSRVLARLPERSRCLMASLVLCGLLARRGVTCPLVIGVRQGSSFGAHAWVELDGRPLLPPNEAEFERLVTL